MEYNIKQETFKHYHGDKVRVLFVIADFIMVVVFPFFRSLISLPMPLSILGSIALAVFGGLMNPKQKWVIFLNTLLPVVAFLFFEYYAVYAYNNLSPAESLHRTFFWVNQLLALIFFFAAYLSTKSLRGALVPDKD